AILWWTDVGTVLFCFLCDLGELRGAFCRSRGSSPAGTGPLGVSERSVVGCSPAVFSRSSGPGAGDEQPTGVPRVGDANPVCCGQVQANDPLSRIQGVTNWPAIAPEGANLGSRVRTNRDARTRSVLECGDT